ncbi:HAD family hydrolase [Niallia endozanthoxylica]|uniref:HAD family hydrolase n=1 Tax=Niallia endozanthoxylica TaxID=2036016 RepID=A0A5J5I3S6_9BACI|nr:HAD family hydrolase [Niallia endozanthoxylica]KAA9028546.1 HAD family hydrolase [Niallia endozanthoxylica]
MDSMIFDLDGTLWDPTDTILLAWESILKEDERIISKITKKDLKSVMGLQVPEIGKRLFPYLDEQTREQILEDCCLAENKYIEKYGGILYSYVEDVLKVLSQKYKLFIVSNCQDGYIEAFYQYHQLDQYFTDYENPGRTLLSKGENIKLIMERNHLFQSVYVGDTEGDQKAARYAGIPFVYAKYGFGQVREYDYVIETFDELVRIF